MGILDLLLCGLLFLSVSCSQLVPPTSRSTAEPTNSFEAVQLGTMKNTEGSANVNLDAISRSSLVLVFASDTCVTCAREAQYWKEIFSSGLPTNIYFAHILIGGNIQDAADWKEFYSVNWDVLIQENDDLYRKYCSSIITPCFVILNKQTNKITQTYQILNKENIERITGPWIF